MNCSTFSGGLLSSRTLRSLNSRSVDGVSTAGHAEEYSHFVHDLANGPLVRWARCYIGSRDRSRDRRGFRGGICAGAVIAGTSAGFIADSIELSFESIGIR